MRILLINPPQFGIFSEGLQPLGIAMIGGVLEGAGHEVRIKDFTVESYTDTVLEKEISGFKPSIVGFSITTPVADFVYKKMVPIVRRNSNAVIIAGGPHPTILHEEALRYVDIVVKGEGEETILELIEKLDSPEEVRGIAFKKGHMIYVTPARNFIADLDSLPFPARELLPPVENYQGLPSVKYRRVYNISTSRGCPFNCVFCYQGVFGRRFRARSPQNVVEEWEYLVKEKRAEVITISDDTFTTDPERVEKICRLLIQRNLRIPWTCSNGIRIGRDTAELLPLMKTAGCVHVAFGIESGNEESLYKINKGISTDLVRKTVYSARRAGIKTVVGFFMIGFPWEDRSAILDTIEFACSLPLDYAHFTVPIPFPGTDLYELFLTLYENNPPPYSCFYPHSQYIFFEGKDLSKEDIKELYRTAYRKFYLRPQVIFNHLFRAISSFRLFKRYATEIFKFFF